MSIPASLLSAEYKRAMELGHHQLQFFISLTVIVVAALIALVCDFLKRNNEQLRELTIELRVRREEEEKRLQASPRIRSRRRKRSRKPRWLPLLPPRPLLWPRSGSALKSRVVPNENAPSMRKRWPPWSAEPCWQDREAVRKP